MADYNSSYTGEQIDEAIGKARSIQANPTLVGTEDKLRGLKIGNTQYVVSASGDELEFQVTLSASSWINNSITVSNANFLAGGYSYLVAPNAPDFDEWCYCRIYGNNVTTDGAMTFTCANTPPGNITVNVLRKVVST